MFKKTTIRILIITVLCALSLWAIVYSLSYVDFLDNKKLAVEYVQNKYDFSFVLLNSKKGKSSYPAPRSDSFLFYDKDNKFYFVVSSYDKEFRDSYSEPSEQMIIFP